MHEAAPLRGGDDFGAAKVIQLGEDATQVGLHRGFADVEVRADFLVASADMKVGEQGSPEWILALQAVAVGGNFEA